MLRIKICGIRRNEDVDHINEFRPEYCGFILSQGFGRSIDYELFSLLQSRLDTNIKSVGVFVNENIDKIISFSKKLDVIQLHGNENEEYICRLKKNTSCEIWKAVRAKSSEDIENACKLSCDKLLIDSFVKGKIGGSGKIADFEVIRKAQISKPFFLAGGLDKGNVMTSVNAVYPNTPVGVDLSSSVETNGVKDREKIRELISTIRGGNYLG